jgi:hypothetical protein
MLDCGQCVPSPGGCVLEQSFNHVLEPGVRYLPDFYTQGWLTKL